MQQYINTVTNRGGASIPGASVLVKTLAGATATIYSDDGVTEASNPLTTDENGEFSFYAADGRYSLTISKTGVISQRTVSDILLQDPDDDTAEQDANDVFHLPAGTGGVQESVYDALERVRFLAQYSSEANYLTALAALTGQIGLPPAVDIAPSGSASYFPLTLRTYDEDSAHMGAALSTLTFNGTVDSVMYFGYNAGGAGSRRDSSEPAWFLTFESNYDNGADNYMECHLEGIHGDGTSFRNWSWTVDRSSKAIAHLMAATTYSIYDATTTNQAVSFTISTSACAIGLSSGTVIQHGANNESWLRQMNAAASAFIEIARVTDSNYVMLAPGGQTTYVAGALEIGGNKIQMWGQPSWFIQNESDTDPTTSELDADDSVAIYNKNDKFVIAYNNGGTITYLSIALDGSTTTWTHSTSAP